MAASAQSRGGGRDVWDPTQYLLFDEMRARPGAELIARVMHTLEAWKLAAPTRIADLGCGPGKQVAALARSFPRAQALTGIDASENMIRTAEGNRASMEAPARITFKQASFEGFTESEKAALCQPCRQRACRCLGRFELTRVRSLICAFGCAIVPRVLTCSTRMPHCIVPGITSRCSRSSSRGRRPLRLPDGQHLPRALAPRIRLMRKALDFFATQPDELEAHGLICAPLCLCLLPAVDGFTMNRDEKQTR